MQEIEKQEAEHGERMIELKVRFWTNDMTDEEPVERGKGKIRPKHAWGSGVVRIKPNKAHGISTGKVVPFNSLMEIPSAIERVLINNGVSIHRSRKMKKYAPNVEAERGRRERARRHTAN